MIFDHRVYTCRPGRLLPHVELFGQYGLNVYRRHIGEPVLFGLAESGGLNAYVHVWAYEDAAHREEMRERIHHDPGWGEQRRLGRAGGGNVIHQTNSILVPAPFFIYDKG